MKEEQAPGKGKKAILLLSGGMDSSIAGKLVADQGVKLFGIKFGSPFCQCDTGGQCNAKLVAENLDIEFRNIPKGEDYLEVIRNPRFGYGKNMNPCIDCRIFMLKKTKKLMEELGADFIITGEVLGQRPKSQHRQAIELIEKEAGLEGLILRPLSAGLIKKSIPEKKGWVDASKWPQIQGRSRKVQIELVGELKIQGCSSPAGGCLLTVSQFGDKIRDLFENKAEVAWTDINRLKAGRHFRVDGTKVVIGRNESENDRLVRLYKEDGLFLEAEGVGSPIGVVEMEYDAEAVCGGFHPEVVLKAAGMVLRYSDSPDEAGEVNLLKFDSGELVVFDTIQVQKASDDDISKDRI